MAAVFVHNHVSVAGTMLDPRYRLERVLGEGATSTVYAATDTRLERKVAVKLIQRHFAATKSGADSRFVREARALAKVAHPNVVAIHDVGQTASGMSFLVMELASQGSLESELQARGRIPPHELMTLLLPVMGALACAHDRGVVHRDLKPGNIVLDGGPDGPRRAKVLDFGIAKVLDADTGSGYVLGTPAYMAPEQATAGELGPHTDVWAMGVLLFLALSGRLPFEAPTSAGMLVKIVNGRAPLLGQVCSDIGPRLALAIDRALEPRPLLRYQDMRELARAIGVACRLDGVRLADDPDPLGLPHFAHWLAQANLHTTCDLYAEREAVAVDDPVRPRRARAVLAALATGAGLLAGVAWSAGALNLAGTAERLASPDEHDPPPKPGLPRANVAIHAQRGTGPASTAVVRAGGDEVTPTTPVSVPTAPTLSLRAEVAPDPLAAPLRPAGRSRQRVRSSADRARKAAPPVPAEVPATLPSGQADGGVITQWDW